MKKQLLAITPNLSLNGANVALLELMKLLGKRYSLSVLSSEDGIFREQVAKEGADIEIQPVVRTDMEFRNRMQSAYDLVLLNSSSVHYYALLLQNTDVHTVWWFHESREQLEATQDDMPHIGLLSKNFTFLAVSESVRRGLMERYHVEAKVLHVPVHDEKDHGATGDPPSSNQNDNKTLFFIPAAYTGIKGQDILLKAIVQLPRECADKARFVFAGYHLPEQEAYYAGLKRIVDKLPGVEMLDELDRQDVFSWYRQCDCVIAPSRVDTGPLSAIEAMMFGKLCLVSDKTGVSEYLEDCQNGFVFPNENVEELLKRLILIISNKTEMQPIADRGRILYETVFSADAVARTVEMIF